MRILHVAPWPGLMLGGGNLALKIILRELGRRHPASFVFFRNPGTTEEMTPEALDELGIPSEVLHVVDVPPRPLLDRVAGLLDLRRPPGVSFREKYVGPALRARAEDVIASWKPDVLVVWRRELAGVFHDLPSLPRVLYACDSSSMVMRSFSERARNPLTKLRYASYASRYTRFEQELYPRYDGVIFISQRDADHVSLPASVPVSIVCNGVDGEAFRPLDPGQEKPTPARILFHGFMASRPNAACALRLADEVGPRLEKALGADGFEIRICGPVPDDLASQLSRRPWMHLAGYVDDLRLELASGTVYASPLTMGGGVKNKVLDAMACGLPVVGTAESFSGLSLEPGVDAVVTSVDAVADEILALLDDPERRRRVGEAARRWVLAHADWRASARDFEAALEGAVARRATPGIR